MYNEYNKYDNAKALFKNNNIKDMQRRHHTCDGMTMHEKNCFFMLKNMKL